jgi:hypothetical protein
MIMNQFNITALALAIGMTMTFGALAQGISQNDYQAGKTTIAAQHTSDMAACDAYSANAKDICVATAAGRQTVAQAELESKYVPTPQNRYSEQVARAHADRAVAVQRCDDQAGNAKDVCMKEAAALDTAATADAEAQLKTTDANATAAIKSAAARSDAKESSAVAQDDAAADKRDAELELAMQKCESFAGSAKTACIAQANTAYDAN